MNRRPVVPSGSVPSPTKASGSLTASANACEAARPSASVAVRAKLNGPLAVGVPVTTPVAGSSRSPGGSAPAVTANVVGPRPPAVATGWLYGTPRVRAARPAVVTARGLLTAPLKSWLTCRPSASVAVTAKPNGPPAVGVPAMTPVTRSRLSPAGSAPPVTANVIGPRPPATAMAWLYGTPRVGAAKAVVVVVRGLLTAPLKAWLTCRPSASVAVTAKLNGAAVVGVPLTVPVAGSSVRPTGSVPAVTANVVGPRPPVVATGAL